MQYRSMSTNSTRKEVVTCKMIPTWYLALFLVVPAIFTYIGIKKHLKTKQERKAAKAARKEQRRGR